MRQLIFAFCIGLLPFAANAVEPDEMLTDPVLEQRAREISKDLRCVVCQNQDIDSSNAGVARDLRLLVRERLVTGDSDAEVIGIRRSFERYRGSSLLSASHRPLLSEIKETSGSSTAARSVRSTVGSDEIALKCRGR